MKVIARTGPVLALALYAGPAAAQTLEIAPITIDLPPGRLTSTIKVTNRGDQPTTVQFRPFAWSQADGVDQLDATPLLLVSPPFATLGAGESQTVRVVLRKAASGHEDSYRLLVDQLPPAAAPGSVRVALRISLPLFAAASGQTKPLLGWRLRRDSATATTLLVRNDGQRRLRIADLKLTAPGVDVTAPGFGFKYVLAGSELAIPLAAGAGRQMPDRIHVAASSDQGKVEADAAPSQDP